MISYTRDQLELAFANMDQYVPREADQWPSMLSQARIVVIGGGERAGKSCNEGHFAGAYAATNIDDLIWIVGPDYKQAQPEFRYAMQALEKGKLLYGEPSMPREGSWQLKTITNTVLYTRTAEEAVKLAGEAPGLILQVEAGQQDISVFEQLMGRTAEKRSQLRVSGTFEKAAAWYDGLWRRGRDWPNDADIQSFAMPSWNNTKLFPGGYDDPEIQKQLKALGERTFSRRFAGEPPPLMGQVYTDFDPGKHVCEPFTIKPYWYRFRVIDAGISEYHPFCCLWIAVDEKRNVVVYRELWVKNHTIPEASKKIKDLSGNEAYKMTLIDPSAYSRSRQSGRTDAWEFSNNGIHCYPANSRDTARISRVMQFFRSDKIQIFSTCENLIRTLPLQVWDTKIGKEKRDPRIEDDPVDCLEYFGTYLGAPVLTSPKDVLRDEYNRVLHAKDMDPKEKSEALKNIQGRIEGVRLFEDLKRMRGDAAKKPESWRMAEMEATP
jgi:hypothetical protein